jgi:hypothetical protein
MSDLGIDPRGPEFFEIACLNSKEFISSPNSLKFGQEIKGSKSSKRDYQINIV